MDLWTPRRSPTRSAWKITDHRVISQPDGNQINLGLIRPAGREILQASTTSMGGQTSLSYYEGNHRAMSRMISDQGVAVAMIDFRDSISPSSIPQVARYPAGLNDASPVSNGLSRTPGAWALTARGLSWPVRAAAGTSPWRPGSAQKRRQTRTHEGAVRSLCPYIAGSWPRPDLPSPRRTTDACWISTTNGGAMGYSIDEFEGRNPLA